MALSRLLFRMNAFSAAPMIAALKKCPLYVSSDRAEARHFSHQPAAENFSESQHHHLQSTLEDLMSVIGGKMVVADMQFTRDGFEYWKSAAIPSSSLVRGVASTWAKTGVDGVISGWPFKFHAEQTSGKKMDTFVQRMVADVGQMASTKGCNSLQNRRFDVKLADEQELLTEEEKQEPKQVLTRTSQDVESVVLTELQPPEAGGTANMADVQLANEQGLTIMKEGKYKAEQATVDASKLVTEEETSETLDEFVRQLVVQSTLEQAAAAAQEKAEATQEVGKGLDTQSKGEQDFITKDYKTKRKQGLKRQVDVEEVKSLEKSDVTDNLSKSSAEFLSIDEQQNAKATESLLMNEQQGAEVQKGEANHQHIKDSSSKRRQNQFVDNSKQNGMERKKMPEASQGIQSDDGRAAQRAGSAEKQNFGIVKDYHQQQTDNIVKMTRWMGKKVVHIYYDKSAPRRASLYR